MPDDGSASLVFPEGFDEYAWEVEEKGIFWDAKIVIGSHQISICFYDPQRLFQDAVEQLSAGSVFFEPNVLVIEKVTKELMLKSVDELVRNKRILQLRPI